MSNHVVKVQASKVYFLVIHVVDMVIICWSMWLSPIPTVADSRMRYYFVSARVGVVKFPKSFEEAML